MKSFFILLCCGLLLLSGCREPAPPEAEQSRPADTVREAGPRQKGCRACHPDTGHDKAHDFACTRCHAGDLKAVDREAAHTGLVARPGHPDHAMEYCGSCHPDQVGKSRESLHATLRNMVNLTRSHFGAGEEIANLTLVPQVSVPTDRTGLADDMLRRRCLRCHLYSNGDDYAATRRATGCAACHLDLQGKGSEKHVFSGIPADRRCLSCHYGNHVGADYYGWYENDYNNEYRTPYTTSKPFFRPYGVELHELAPDIHRQRGLACLDCHNEHQGQKLTCTSCHWLPDEKPARLPDNIRMTADGPVLISLAGASHPVPLRRDPAHARYGDQVTCQVCHAQWAFNDSTSSLLRSDTDDYDTWAALPVQGSSEVERLLKHNLYADEDELPPTMRDGITNEPIPGVWFKGFGQRRWEDIIIRRDSDGIIKVFRPILDLRLTYIDEDGDLRFDAISGSNGDGLLPYTPHTTGPAGIFYQKRFGDLLQPDKDSSNSKERR